MSPFAILKLHCISSVNYILHHSAFYLYISMFPCGMAEVCVSFQAVSEEDQGASNNGENGPDSGSNDKDDKDSKKKKNRCATCRKKVGLTGMCGGIYV